MSFLDQIHKSYRVTADYAQEHAKMYKENHWYKAWYDTMVDGHKLKDKLSKIASTIDIYLEGYEPLPEGLDKEDWNGYVLITESSLKRLLKEGEEAEKLVKEIKDRK
jgi:hypothetical protein